MSTPPPVTEARLALARRLAILGHDAGFTQAHAAHGIEYSRSAVARAEATGVCSCDFCRRPVTAVKPAYLICYRLTH